MAQAIKISPAQWIQIILTISRAFRAVSVEMKRARDPESERGRRISTAEAVDIVAAAFAGAVEPVAEILADAD